jgi:hypothetical protein
MTSEKPRLSAVEAFCLGKLVSECGEFAQAAGNALCYGIDTPDAGMVGRARLEEELGDIHAAICFASLHRVVSATAIAQRSSRKLAKLLDPSQEDNLGRPLAPQPEHTHKPVYLPIPGTEPGSDAIAGEDIRVSLDVANALRNLTGTGASGVDDLLRRLLKIDQAVDVSLDGPVGYRDPATGLTLPEGFEIFRVLDGRTFTARAQGGVLLQL